MSFGSTLDFLPKLIQLPSGAGTVINVTEEYLSDPFFSTPDSQFMSQLKCSRTTTLTLGGRRFRRSAGELGDAFNRYRRTADHD